MLRTFITVLSNGVGEITALGSLVALILIGLRWKEQERFRLWLLLPLLLFMVGWRVAICIASSRYASVLIYPASVLTVWASFETGRMLQRFSNLPEKWCKFISCAVLGGVLAGSLAMTFRINPYEKNVFELYDCIARECKADPSLLIWSSDSHRRFQYYIGVIAEQKVPKQVEKLNAKIASLPPGSHILLVRKESRNETINFASGELPPGTEWSLIYRQPADRKQRKFNVVYRCRIPKKTTSHQ